MNAAPTHRLRLFGTPSLERADGSPLTGGAAQRHRLALLALLALAPGQRMSRDKLIAYLWPDSDAERGRNLLNVATYTVRKALGDGAIVTAVDDLCLDPAVVGADVTEFAAALAAGDPARAVALYRGPFLDGFFLGDAALEPWVERERARLAADHDRALEALAEAAEQAHDHARAADWWKRRAAADPYDSRVALRLMQALDASGNRPGALQHATVHQRLLEQELGSGAVPAALRELATRLREAPAAPAAPTSPPPAPIVVAPSDVPPAAPAVLSRRRPARRWLRLVVPLAFVAVAALVRVAAPWDPGPARSIVVLPFVSLSSDADDGYFADGLTDEVITRLAAVPGLKVISRTSAMHYKGSTQPLRAIARELDVAQVLEGSVQRRDGRVRVTVQLIDAATDDHRWADSFEYDRDASFRVQEDIAREVARVLEVGLSDRARRQLARRGTSNAEAYDLYQRARFLWQTRTRDGHAQAIQLYERAIALDSGYADAYAGLTDAYLTAWQNNVLGLSEAESYARMKAAADRALALDDESAAAHSAVAMVLWWQRDWPGAMRELRRSLELNPGQAMTRSWYSLLLRPTGHAAEATRENRRADGLDPYAVAIVNNTGWHCYLDRDLACAVEQFRRATALAPFPPAYAGLAVAESQRGQHAAALDAIRQVIALAPQRFELRADLAYVQARAGRAREAREALAEATRHDAEGFNVGRAYAALGEPDSAFAWLDRARWQWPHRAVLDDPALDPLRADPRFARLRARITREMGLR